MRLADEIGSRHHRCPTAKMRDRVDPELGDELDEAFDAIRAFRQERRGSSRGPNAARLREALTARGVEDIPSQDEMSRHIAGACTCRD